MNKSESIKELATALAKAQAKLKNPPFDSKNPHFKSSYASLASVRDTIIPTLAEFGLSLIQNVSSRENGVCCSNLLMHVSGEWLETDPLEVPADKRNAHGYGSACTYARRFSLMALGVVVGDVDDDGNEAAKGAIKPTKITPTSGAWEEMDEESQTFLQNLADEVLSIVVDGDIQAAYSHLHSQHLTTEEKAALWTRFDSKVRAALTKEGQRVKELKTAA